MFELIMYNIFPVMRMNATDIKQTSGIASLPPKWNTFAEVEADFRNLFNSPNITWLWDLHETVCFTMMMCTIFYYPHSLLNRCLYYYLYKFMYFLLGKQK